MLSCGNSIGGSRSTGRKRKLKSPSVMTMRNTIVVAIGRLTETSAMAMALRLPLVAASVQGLGLLAQERFLAALDDVEEVSRLHLLQSNDVVPWGRLDHRFARVAPLEQVMAERDDPITGLHAAHRARQPASGDDLDGLEAHRHRADGLERARGERLSCRALRIGDGFPERRDVYADPPVSGVAINRAVRNQRGRFGLAVQHV